MTSGSAFSIDVGPSFLFFLVVRPLCCMRSNTWSNTWQNPSREVAHLAAPIAAFTRRRDEFRANCFKGLHANKFACAVAQERGGVLCCPTHAVRTRSGQERPLLRRAASAPVLTRT